MFVKQGSIQYNVKYIDSTQRNFKKEIDALLKAFNQSLSTYIPDSEISRFNRDTLLEFSTPFFYPVLAKSKEVSEATEQAFDPTVAPLVNTWGFGRNKETPEPSPQTIDSLKQLIGFDKLDFDEKSVRKTESRLQLDFSAIAKGYAVDIVADFLTSRGIQNYMVDIGGELACRGKNEKGRGFQCHRTRRRALRTGSSQSIT